MSEYKSLLANAGLNISEPNSYYYALRLLTVATYIYQSELMKSGQRISNSKASYTIVSDFFIANQQKFAARANRDTIYKYEKRFEKAIEWCLARIYNHQINDKNIVIDTSLIDQFYKTLEDFSPNLSAIDKGITKYHGMSINSDSHKNIEDSLIDEFHELKINLLEINELLSLARHGDKKAINTIEVLKIHFSSTRHLLNEWLYD